MKRRRILTRAKALGEQWAVADCRERAIDPTELLRVPLRDALVEMHVSTGVDCPCEYNSSCRFVAESRNSR